MEDNTADCLLFVSPDCGFEVSALCDRAINSLVEFSRLLFEHLEFIMVGIERDISSECLFPHCNLWFPATFTIDQADSSHCIGPRQQGIS